ncbi:hypothetical protein LCGC14_2108620 [marine sediment metagenome]|uniref:Uncharacterized protein n=1 Tax=marine sediment metagenome TaxID=412755 RepID=A0A0F9E7N2_9ZZZZ
MAKKNHYSIFKVDNSTPEYLHNTKLFIADFLEGTLELDEELTAAVALNGLVGNESLELVMIPGNKQPNDYVVGAVLMTFTLLSLEVKQVRGADQRRDYTYMTCLFYSTMEMV